jgi:hypothetical protein
LDIDKYARNMAYAKMKLSASVKMLERTTGSNNKKSHTWGL